jgi:hypothetical protein
MLEKKLLTLLCALGILACGACFLPPSQGPPPPPLYSGLRGVHTIRVEVANVSESHHVDAAEMAREVAQAINGQQWKSAVSAFVDEKKGDADAVLKITIDGETVEQKSPDKSGSSSCCLFHINDSATLVKRTGEVIWHETGVGNPILAHVPESGADDLWVDPALMKHVVSVLGNRVTRRMFYLR